MKIYNLATLTVEEKIEILKNLEQLSKSFFVITLLGLVIMLFLLVLLWKVWRL